MARKKTQRIWVYLAVAVAAAYVIGLYSALSVPQVREMIETPAINTTGLVEADVSIEGASLSLAHECKAIAFDITQDQAFSISHGLAGTFPERPLTHDILSDIMKQYGIKALQIKIDRFEDEIYKARIILYANGKMVELDARPSDSVALAARLDMPVYLDNNILVSFGRNVC